MVTALAQCPQCLLTLNFPLKLNGSLLCMCINVIYCLPNHLSLLVFFFLDSKKIPAMNMDTQISLETLLTMLNIYPEVELLNQMVILPANYLGNCRITLHSSCSISQSHQWCPRVPISLYHHQHLFTLSFMLAHYVRQQHIVLICISLLTSDVLSIFSGTNWPSIFLLISDQVLSFGQ